MTGSTTSTVNVLTDRLFTRDEIAEITKKSRYSAQVRMLNQQGVYPLLDDDGAPILASYALALAMNTPPIASEQLHEATE